MAERKGTRCAVCVGCGRCFADEGRGRASVQKWTGDRCDACVGCGKCFEAWGFADAESGPTNWAEAFKVMDTGQGAPAPPTPGAPGTISAPGALSGDAAGGAVTSGDAPSAREGKPSASFCGDADAATGATPGVAAACKEFGFDDLETMNKVLGIKPPGVA